MPSASAWRDWLEDEDSARRDRTERQHATLVRAGLLDLGDWFRYPVTQHVAEKVPAYTQPL